MGRTRSRPAHWRLPCRKISQWWKNALTWALWTAQEETSAWEWAEKAASDLRKEPGQQESEQGGWEATLDKGPACAGAWTIAGSLLQDPGWLERRAVGDGGQEPEGRGAQAKRSPWLTQDSVGTSCGRVWGRGGAWSHVCSGDIRARKDFCAKVTVFWPQSKTRYRLRKERLQEKKKSFLNAVCGGWGGSRCADPRARGGGASGGSSCDQKLQRVKETQAQVVDQHLNPH